MQVSHGKAAPLKRIKPGDRVVYYSPTVTLGARGDRETCRLGKERHGLQANAPREGDALAHDFDFRFPLRGRLRGTSRTHHASVCRSLYRYSIDGRTRSGGR